MWKNRDIPIGKLGGWILYRERGFGRLLDPPPYKEHLPEFPENNSKIGRKVCLNSVGVIFYFALFLDACKSGISQPQPRSRTVVKTRTIPKPTFFQKIDLILSPGPIHKDGNDRKWIL